MKRTYVKPEVNTEHFDVEDVITASAPGQVDGRLTSTHDNWGVNEIPLGDVTIN